MTNEEAIAILNRPMLMKNVPAEIIEAHEMAIKAIKQEPKTGRWIIDGHHRKCQNCGEYFCITDAEGDKIPSDFCPNCGSKNE